MQTNAAQTDSDFYLSLLNTLESDVWNVWAMCVPHEQDAPEPDDERDMSQAQVMLEQIANHIRTLRGDS